MTRRPPTDFEILRAVRDLHRDAYLANVAKATTPHHLRTHVPVDLAALAEHLHSDVDTVFGRLYYHLDPKYGGPADQQPRKVLFTPKLASDENCVNYPLVEAVLAGLWQERRRNLLALTTAFLSLGVAAASLLVSLLR